MPLSVILIVVGILLICAATYLTMPSPIHGLCMFGGVACILIGVVLLLVGLLSVAGGVKISMILLGT